MQALDHPNFADAGIFPTCDYPRVEESQFVEHMVKAMKAQNVSQTELAKAVGFTSQSAISNLIKGKRRLKLDERTKIERYLMIEPEPQIGWVPIIGIAAAGAWQEAIRLPVRERPVPLRIAGKRSFGVEIKGDSMNRLLPEGGWAIVDPDQVHLYNGRVYLIENAEHEVTVKRYCGDPARFEPVSDNDMHQPIMVAGTLCRVIGRVVSYGNDDGL